MEIILIWAGFILALYLSIGFILGLVVVWSNLARFFVAGFRWKRMAVHVAKVTVAWPLMVVFY